MRFHFVVIAGGCRVESLGTCQLRTKVRRDTPGRTPGERERELVALIEATIATAASMHGGSRVDAPLAGPSTFIEKLRPEPLELLPRAMYEHAHQVARRDALAVAGCRAAWRC